MPHPKRGAEPGPRAPAAKRRAREPASTADAAAFRALRVDVAGDAPFPRHVYVKIHEEGGSGRPRAAFVTGLPPTWRPLQEVLRALVEPCGEVETIVVGKDETSAIVSFTSHAGLTALLAAAASARPMTVDLPPTEAPFGLKAWVEAHKAAFPGNDVLGAELDAWVAAYEAEDARRKAEAAAAAEGDGWTVVVRSGGRKKSAAGGGASIGAVAPAAAAAALEAKKSRLEADFYRFQRREAKRGELADLRAKFEEDKKRVAALREARRFRPA